MAFTKKIAGWAAGRLKGEKARKDTMRWMEKTGLGQLLGVGGDAALIGGALKGAGALKGLLSGGAGSIPALPAQAPMINTPVPSAITGMGAGAPAALPPMPSPGGAISSLPGRVASGITPPPVGSGAQAPSLMSRMLGGAGSALSGAAKFGRENAGWIAPAAGAVADVLGQRSQQQIEEQRMAQQQSQFQKTFDVGEDERRRLREQQNRLASLFMPRSA